LERYGDNLKKKIKEKILVLKAAFPYTIPVLTGYIFLGAAYGILMKSKGYGVFWSVLASLLIYAGSAQYVTITFLTSIFNPIYTFIMILMVNARHLFYGISMLDKYKETGKLKPYLIFAMSDETFSIVCSTEAPEGIDRNWFYFFITFLDYLYWAAGSAIGAFLGSLISFNTKGLDFVLTALFVSIFVGQWKGQKDHKAAIIGLLCSIVSLYIFGQSNFIIPSMILIIIVLTLFYKKDVKKEELKEEVVQ